MASAYVPSGASMLAKGGGRFSGPYPAMPSRGVDRATCCDRSQPSPARQDSFILGPTLGDPGGATPYNSQEIPRREAGIFTLSVDRPQPPSGLSHATPEPDGGN